MELLYFIKCRNCSHKKVLDDDWWNTARQNLENHQGLDPEKLFDVLKSRLICTECGGRNPTLQKSMKWRPTRVSRPSGTISIEQLLNQRTWLYKREIDMLENLLRQAKTKGFLTQKQRRTVHRINDKVKIRQVPVTFRG